jgi:hypothetical protein
VVVVEARAIGQHQIALISVKLIGRAALGQVAARRCLAQFFDSEPAHVLMRIFALVVQRIRTPGAVTARTKVMESATTS